MSRVCCNDLWNAMLNRALEWTPVSDGDESGPLVVGWWTSWGFLPLFHCPYCGEAV